MNTAQTFNWLSSSRGGMNMPWNTGKGKTVDRNAVSGLPDP